MSVIDAERVLLGRDGLPIKQIKIHRKQAEVLAATERFLVCAWARRTGKSELGVLWVLMQAHKYRSQGVKGVAWIVCPGYSHTVTIWRKIHRLVPEGWITSQSGNENLPGHITFGSVRIEFKSAAKPERLVGEGLLFCLIDECGIIKERTWNESLRPTLMDRAAPVFFSGSPKGNNWYYDMYQHGWDPDPKYDHIKSFGIDRKFGYSSYINPFIPNVNEEIAQIRTDMTERTFRQEIMAEFLTGEGAVFRRIREQVMLPHNQLAWADKDGLIRQGWGKVGKTICLGIDLARFKDWSVIVGMDKYFRVSYFDRFQQIDYPIQKARIKAAYHKLGKPTIVLDSTHGSVGDPIAADLVADGIRVHKFEFTGVSKGPLVEDVVIGLEQGKIWLPDEPIMINELELFDGKMRESGKMFYSAPPNKHDDVVMSLCLAYFGARRFGDSGITFPT